MTKRNTDLINDMKTWFEEMDFAIKERSRIADGRVISKDKRLKLYSDFMERAIQLMGECVKNEDETYINPFKEMLKQ